MQPTTKAINVQAEIKFFSTLSKENKTVDAYVYVFKIQHIYFSHLFFNQINRPTLWISLRFFFVFCSELWEWRGSNEGGEKCFELQPTNKLLLMMTGSLEPKVLLLREIESKARRHFFFNSYWRHWCLLNCFCAAHFTLSRIYKINQAAPIPRNRLELWVYVLFDINPN